MYTATHSTLRANASEPVRITYTITDNSGNTVSLSGASAILRIARKKGDSHLVQKTGGDIELSGNTAIVSFNTGELVDENDQQLLGDFMMQLFITKSGDTLVVAEGRLEVGPVIP